MSQTSKQTQLLLHEPEQADDYIIDTSDDFTQVSDASASDNLTHPACGGGKGGDDATETNPSIATQKPPLPTPSESPSPPQAGGMNYASLIEAATPAMKQYFKAKVENPDSLLFYRMGDFYEMFFDDALEAAAILDIALTKRGKQGDMEIPMCGVPFHAYEAYAEKLIRAGKRVAVCEQMESPEEAKKRGYKSIVHREVVRILTPGTLTEEALLDASSSNYLACIAGSGSHYAAAWLDFSTGEVMTSACAKTELTATLSRINPKELVLSDAVQTDASLKPMLDEYVDISIAKPDHLFEVDRAKRRVMDSYQLANLAPLGASEDIEFSALGALLEYVAITQKSQMPRLDLPVRVLSAQVMQLDQATQRNLELVVRQNGEKKLSLLHTIDRTQTASGSRLLSSMLVAPLTDVAAINQRLDAVAMFASKETLRRDCRDVLSAAADSERALSRLTLERGHPRDMLAVKYSLTAARDINGLFEQSKQKDMPALIAADWQALRGHEETIDRLAAAIKPDASGLLRDGNFIQAGFNAALDEYRGLKENGRQTIAKMQQDYQAKTGINTLKIKFNHVLGYFVEITPKHQGSITEEFIHRQSLASALRYTTTELSELEQNISQASDRALKLELELFEKLRVEILEREQAIIDAARALARVDVFSALAELALREKYNRPKIDDTQAFHIEGGRHPVVERSLGQQGEQFAPNDCDMGAGKLWLLTGPNMAGKSTYLRQNALIAILAQMGSFVPAKAAHIGVIDKCFSRVGAADDLARGQSTFMVEMAETAGILAQATERSYVILDEIGRGTATYDGLSIAWAVVEHIHNQIKCRTLFATHYHELTSLKEELENMACYHLLVKEYKGQLVFMHQVASGNAEGSYGVHVAKIAGLPKEVITRAAQLLSSFDRQREGHQMPAATEAMADAAPAESSALAQALEQIDPNSLSPREALDALFKLKDLA